MRPLGHLIQGLISSCSFPKGSPLKCHIGLEGFSMNLGSDINTQSYHQALNHSTSGGREERLVSSEQPELCMVRTYLQT